MVDAAAADAEDGNEDADENGNGNEAEEEVGVEAGGAQAEADAAAGQDAAAPEAEAEADANPSQSDNDVGNEAVEDQQNPNLNRFLVNYPGESPSSSPVQHDDYYVQPQRLAKLNPFGLVGPGIGGQPSLGSISSFGSYPSASPGAQHSSYYL